MSSCRQVWSSEGKELIANCPDAVMIFNGSIQSNIIDKIAQTNPIPIDAPIQDTCQHGVSVHQPRHPPTT